MEKAQEILFHIDELYTENPSEEKIIRQSQENPVRYQAWVDAFKDYDLSDVLQAIDEYWEFKNSKTKPSVAQIKAKLNARNVEKVDVSVGDSIKNYIVDPAITQRLQDIADGNCHHNMPDYNEALKLILDQYLPLEVPAAVYVKMGWEAKVKEAKRRGLFGRFSEALKEVSLKKRGREYEFMSANDELALAKDKIADMPETLASHWRA